MKALLLIAALGLGGIQATPQTSSLAASGTISGVVRIADANTPMPGTVVHLTRFDADYDPLSSDLNKKPPVATTNESGRFTFNDVKAVKYGLWIDSPPGYVWLDYEKYDLYVPVTVGPAQQADNVVFRLVPRGSISGRVLSDRGEPLVGAYVTADCVIYRDGRRKLEGCGAVAATTDTQGNFRIFWLAPGKYYVQTEYHPSMVAPPKVYFPGTLDETLASAVVIKPGSEITGIDFSLVTPPTVPSYNVSGKIVGLLDSAAGRTVESIHLFSQNGKSGETDDSYQNTAASISGGQFQIRGVRAGIYELWAQARDDNGLDYTARTTVEVAGASVENVVADVLPVADLHGRLLVDDKAPEKPFGPGEIAPRIAAIDGTPDYTNFQYEAKNVQFNRDTGEFTILRVPAGRYGIAYYPAQYPNEFVSDVRQGNQSVIDGFTIGKDTPQTIEIFSNTSGGAIDGIAIGADANPLFGATIVIASTPEVGKKVIWYGGLKSGKDGHFSVGRLPPGQYRIYAWINPPLGDPWRNADFMRRYEVLGQTVNVSAGNATTVRVTAIPAGDE